jgi:hypothetical protein
MNKILLQQCMQHLLIVCKHADEDCPIEYRSKWFNKAIQDAYEFIEEYKKGKEA